MSIITRKNSRASCGECTHAARFWKALRCIRNAPKDEFGRITRSVIGGSPLCEQERMDGPITAWMLGTCGEAGRYWSPSSYPIEEPVETSRILHVAVYDDGETFDARVFPTEDERDAWTARMHDDLIYAPVDAEIKERIP